MRCVDKNSNCKGELKREKTINEGGWWNVSGIQASKTAGKAAPFNRTSTAHLTLQLC